MLLIAGMPDPVGRMDGMEVRVEPFRSKLLASTVLLPSFPEDGTLAFGFEQIEPFEGSDPSADADGGTDPDAGMPTGDDGMDSSGDARCRALESFSSRVAPQLFPCRSCHGGTNPAAVDALDLRGLPAGDVEGACTQGWSSVTPDDPLNSPLLVRPDPDSGVPHVFKFSRRQFQNFRNAVLEWLSAEQRARMSDG